MRVLKNALAISTKIFAFIKPTDTPQADIHEALKEFDREDIDEVLGLLCRAESIVEVSPGVYQRWHGDKAQKELRKRLDKP
jgi:hypothetical protein